MPLYPPPLTVDDILMLWDGTPDGTQFLRDDGLYASPFPSPGDIGDVLTLDEDFLPIWAPVGVSSLSGIFTATWITGWGADDTHFSCTADSIADLGTPTAGWRDGHFARDLYLGGGVIYSVGGGMTHASLSGDHNFQHENVGGLWSMRGNTKAFEPAADNVSDIGHFDYRVRDLWTSGRSYLGMLDSPPDDTDLKDGTLSFYADEVADELVFRVRYSDGTLKTGAVALT